MENTTRPILVTHHIPVMLEEVLTAMEPIAGGIFIDCTLGGGGYTQALLARGAKKVVAIDRDPQALVRAKTMAATYGKKLELVEGSFTDIDTIAAQYGLKNVRGVVADLGLSSDQLDDPSRGLSYQLGGMLDMRFAPAGKTAADILNQTREADLADIFYNYGDETKSRPLAKLVVSTRKTKPYKTAADFLATINQLYPPKPWLKRSHPAARLFQALRICVNGEIDALVSLVHKAPNLLELKGKFAVVSFHSLEDRHIKHAFKALTLDNQSFSLRDKKGTPASAAEIARNPRARSARLRVLEKTA